jgi:hypothetical protein
LIWYYFAVKNKCLKNDVMIRSTQIGIFLSPSETKVEILD